MESGSAILHLIPTVNQICGRGVQALQSVIAIYIVVVYTCTQNRSKTSYMNSRAWTGSTYVFPELLVGTYQGVHQQRGRVDSAVFWEACTREALYSVRLLRRSIYIHVLTCIWGQLPCAIRNPFVEPPRHEFYFIWGKRESNPLHTCWEIISYVASQPSAHVSILTLKLLVYLVPRVSKLQASNELPTT